MVVKVTSYTRIRKAAKATIRYIQHRPNELGQWVIRALFGEDGPMERHHAYWLIDHMKKGSVFYRVAFSPDPKREDTYKDLDLWGMTQVAVQYLREKLGKDIQFVATVHDDQTDIRHVNALVMVPGKLTKAEFRLFPKLLRQAAYLDAKAQREQLDPQEAMETEPTAPVWRESAHTATWLRRQDEPETAYRSFHPQKPTCPNCGPDERMWKIEEGTYLCPECGSVFTLSMGTTLQQEGASLSL